MGLNFLYSAVTSITNIGIDATKPYGNGNVACMTITAITDRMITLVVVNHFVLLSFLAVWVLSKPLSMTLAVGLTAFLENPV